MMEQPKKYSDRENGFQFMNDEQVLALRAQAREELSHYEPFDKENKHAKILDRLQQINQECGLRNIGMGKK